jgi:hypothetical protein
MNEKKKLDIWKYNGYERLIKSDKFLTIWKITLTNIFFISTNTYWRYSI